MLHRLTTALMSLSVVYELQIQILHHFQYVSGLLAALLCVPRSRVVTASSKFG